MCYLKKYLFSFFGIQYKHSICFILFIWNIKCVITGGNVLQSLSGKPLTVQKVQTPDGMTTVAAALKQGQVMAKAGQIITKSGQMITPSGQVLTTAPGQLRPGQVITRPGQVIGTSGQVITEIKSTGGTPVQITAGKNITAGKTQVTVWKCWFIVNLIYIRLIDQMDWNKCRSYIHLIQHIYDISTRWRWESTRNNVSVKNYFHLTWENVQL